RRARRRDSVRARQRPICDPRRPQHHRHEAAQVHPRTVGAGALVLPKTVSWPRRLRRTARRGAADGEGRPRDRRNPELHRRRRASRAVPSGGRPRRAVTTGPPGDMTSKALELSSPIGLVAGGGAMPFAVADSLVARGITPVLFALRGACDPVAVERFRHHWISVGQLGRATKLFRREKCRDLVFIGSLVRPALSEIRLDWGTLRVLGKVLTAFRGGDDHLLSGIGDILEQDGFRM